MASRSKAKFRKLLEDTSISDVNKSNLKFLELDLSDVQSCIRAANRFKDLETRVDVVVANAALSVMVRPTSYLQSLEDNRIETS